MKTVKAVEYIDGYRLKLLFDDNKTKIVDLTDMIKKGGHYFKPLQDVELFRQVGLDDDEYPSSIHWPNGADICPDVLYSMGEDIQEDEKQIKSKTRYRRKNVVIKYQEAYSRSKKISKTDT